jgi:photosystem II stability/assembly factor-like uncharacterized protein
VADLSWVDAHHGWALVARPCGPDHRRCAVVYRTTNGGGRWQRVAAPEIRVNMDSEFVGGCVESKSCVSRLWFADRRIGYLFGPGLFMTTDGGRSWTRQPGPFVESLAGSPTRVFRLAFPGTGCPGPCDTRLEATVPRQSDWTGIRHRLPKLGGYGGEVLVANNNVYVIFVGHLAGGVTSRADIEVSHDAGVSWSVVDDPCGTYHGAEVDTVTAAAAGDAFAVLCVTKGGELASFIVVSGDGARSFAPRHVTRLRHASVIGVGNSHTLAVGGPFTRGSGWVDYRLDVTRDGGRSWTTVVRDRAEVTEDLLAGGLDFRTTTTASWVGYPYRIWQTTDSLRHWAAQPAP